MDRKLLKGIIQERGLLDEERLREIEALSASSGKPLLDTLVNGGYVKEEALMPAVAESFGLRWRDIESIEGLESQLYLESPKEIRQMGSLIPLLRENGSVVVATSDAMAVDVLDRVREVTGWRLSVLLTLQDRIDRVRERMENAGKGVTELRPESLEDQSLEDLANEAPIIKLVNLIIMQAISEGASDIHIEPYENKAVVRYRVDGVLRETATYSKVQYPAVISRVKIMADLNIAERRIPQDGRISLRLMDKEYDLRVATIPVLYGEGVVMRILDKGSIKKNLDQLGFAQSTLKTFKEQICRPHGIVLVTGPTGSGKTTTLYAALSAIKSVENKIITVEDPVEYHLEGISQIHVNAKVGLTFAAGLRSILRLDPDIVMVGEIRDAETAEIAIRAALTGHLVFSTLHTNDAPSAATRLLDMGIAPYLISSSLNAVLAQRLMRRVCEFCKTESPLEGASSALFSAPGWEHVKAVYRGSGCDECGGSGYSGRLGVHELLVVTDRLKSLINERAPAETLRAEMIAAKMPTLRDNAMELAASGLTTAEEVLRITGEE